MCIRDRYSRGWGRKFINGVSSLGVTSVVAGLATGLFAIMQFQRWAQYGLLGNLAAMPTFTFIVMPMALVTFLLLPFGLEAAPLWVMGKGLDQMIYVAEAIKSLPQSQLYVKKPPEAYSALYGVVFIVLCLGKWRVKLIALIIGLALAVIWAGAKRPDIRISQEAQLTWYLDGEYYSFNLRQDRFGRERFLQEQGTPEAAVNRAQNLAECDKRGCLLQFGSQSVAIVSSPEEIVEACQQADLLILQHRKSGVRAKRQCKAEIIDISTLKHSGAIELYISDNRIKRKQVRSHRSNRPWDE